MRRLNFLFTAVLAIAGLSFIASCTPNETTNVKPKLNFISEGASITADKTVDAGAPLLFKVNGVSNTSTKKNLKTLRVQSFTNNNPNVDTTVSIKKDSYTGSFNYHAPATASTEEKFTFTLTDNAGETDIVSITVTTAANDPCANAAAISTFSAVLLGAQDNASEGSFLNAHTGNVMLKADADNASSDVDLIYYYGSSNMATVVAPTHSTVNGGSGNLSLATGLTTKRATQVKKSTMTAATFDGITKDCGFPTDVAGSFIANQLSQGDVVEFKTHDNKIGLFKVKSITTGVAGKMEIEVKIQM